MSNSNIIPIDIISIKKEIIKPLSVNSKKGSNGCVATIGGSLEYTGAPYYSAISSLKAGSDLSHVFCHIESAIPIKSYSPELIVHPGFDVSTNEVLIKKTERWFKSMNSILIGPGLGRESEVEKIFVKFSECIYDLKNIPLIYDADGVWFWVDINLKNDCDKNILEKINNNDKLIMTPNFTEFEKMCKILGDNFNKDNIEEQIKFIEEIYENNKNDIIKINDFLNNEKYKKIFLNEINLCNRFNNNFILVKKGKCDIITDGKELYIVKNKGSLKRTGGIGDLLSGLINCYCGMINQQYKENNNNKNNKILIIDHSILIKCCILASYICRSASEFAFEKMKYSLTAPDIINELPNIVNKIYYL